MSGSFLNTVLLIANAGDRGVLVMRFILFTCLSVWSVLLSAQGYDGKDAGQDASRLVVRGIGCENASCNPVGMIQHDFIDYTGQLMARDQPMGYEPERGPWVPFEVRWSEWDDRQEVGAGGEMGRGQGFEQMHLGMNVSISWMAYIQTRHEGDHTAVWYPLEGGYQNLAPLSRNRDHPEWPECADVRPSTACLYASPSGSKVEIRKVTVGEISIHSGDRLPPGSYVVKHLDSGLVEEYGAVRAFRIWNYDPALRVRTDVTELGHRAYLSALVDRHGQAMRFEWYRDEGGVRVEEARLSAVVDQLGRRTQLKYATDALEEYPGRDLDRDYFLLVQVIDPYGNKAKLEYVDAKWGTDPVRSSLVSQAYVSDAVRIAACGGAGWCMNSWRLNGGVARTSYLGGTYRGYTRLTAIVDVVGVRSELEYTGGFNRSEFAGSNWRLAGSCPYSYSTAGLVPGYNGTRPPVSAEEAYAYEQQISASGHNPCNTFVEYQSRAWRNRREDNHPNFTGGACDALWSDGVLLRRCTGRGLPVQASACGERSEWEY